MNNVPLLEVRELCKKYVISRSKENTITAVDCVSFDVTKGETLGLVGESGSGKTTLGKTILRLCEPDSGSIKYGGKILFDNLGANAKYNKKTAVDMLPYRRRMQIIFQNALSSFDPRMTASEIIGEAIDIHGLSSSKAERMDMILELLNEVGLEADSLDKLPHEFSGGEQQRIGIARALAVKPEFIVCDEPVSALDVSIQAQIINLLSDMQSELGLTYLFISHDISVVRHISDRVAVMYMGKVVEIGKRSDVTKQPLHPYTMELLSYDTTSNPNALRRNIRMLSQNEKLILKAPEKGCIFAARCPFAKRDCFDEQPKLRDYGEEHLAACTLINK